MNLYEELSNAWRDKASIIVKIYQEAEKAPGLFKTYDLETSRAEFDYARDQSNFWSEQAATK